MAKNIHEQFPWHFRDDGDIETAWKEGILTVDTNVMLGLYRYHKSAREEFLSALGRFEGRFWISHQTAWEFIKNQERVISDIKDNFDEAQKPINKVVKEMREAVKKMSDLYAIPNKLISTFEKKIKKASSDISDGIQKEKNNIPNYKNDDEIMRQLEKILAETPDGGIGSPPKNIEDDIKEAKQRKDKRIPPGYEDGDKDGLNFAGDYLMWKQILSYSKARKKPMIFVTSDRKEDWWQKKGDEILAPRPELLREAFETTGQKFLIYRTEQFLEKQNILGVKVDKSILDEVSKHSEPAVNTRQEVDFADAEINTGMLVVSISRPVKNFTGTGQLNPKMLISPEVSAKLVSYPEHTPEFYVRANTGTEFDFNVHVLCSGRDAMFPIGIYVLEYRASCEKSAESSGEDST